MLILKTSINDKIKKKKLLVNQFFSPNIIKCH